jgi:hypothetical protein
MTWPGSRGGDGSSGSGREETCLPTAACLEAVDLLQGPLSPAALNPVTCIGPTEPQTVLRGRGTQDRAQPCQALHVVQGQLLCFCAGLDTPLRGTPPHQL